MLCLGDGNMVKNVGTKVDVLVRSLLKLDVR
jgi:hypothetical protein